MSTPGLVLFFIAGFIALLSALGTIALSSPIRAAMSLLAHIVSLSVLFLLLHAHLLAALQVLVYAGAVVVLFVFVIMLLGPAAHDQLMPVQRGALIKSGSGALMALVMALMATSLRQIQQPLAALANCAQAEGAECDQFGGVLAMSKSLFVGAVVPFELIAVLLTVAIVGAVAVGRGRTATEAQALNRKLQEKQHESVADEARERALAARLTTAPPPEQGL